MRLILAGACLLLSGFAGLVYEVCWIREASLVFGSTTQAMSTVVAIFFGGLALGSWLAGRAEPRRPMRIYAALEIALALVAVSTPTLFERADRLFGLVYGQTGPAGAALARMGLVALILLPPATLMGATLPLFCRQIVVDTTRVGASIAHLYAINTLGAALGCMATGLWLMPTIGVTDAIRLAAVGNLLAAAVAWLVPWPDPPTRDPAAEAVAEVRRMGPPSPVGPVLAGALFFFAGFAIVGDEVLWARYLTLLVPHDVYSYTVTLGTILVGIVLGAFLAARLSDQRARLTLAFGALQVVTGLYVLMLTSAPPSFWRTVGHGVEAHFLLLSFPSVASGASFPLAVRMVVGQAREAAAGVGRMAALNTVGGIAGSLVAGFLTLPVIGLQRSLHLFTAVSVVTGLAAWLVPAASRQLRWRSLAAGLVVILWAVTPALADTRVPQDFLAPRERLVDYREGRAGNLAVVAVPGGLELTIDGMWQGQSHKNHQVLAAHLPMLLHPDPDRVLVIGVGAGLAPSRFLMHDLERLDAVDIEPAVFELIDAHFASGWMRDPRVSLLAADGRSHVLHSRDRYDVVSIEVGQTMRPGVGSFYTKDFYRRARARLREGGLISQFLPLQYFPPEAFRRALRSFVEVFPAATLWYNKSELLLIGFEADRVPRLHTERLIDDRLFLDLDFSQWGGTGVYLRRPATLVAGLLLGPEEIAELASPAAPFRDDRPDLDYLVSGLSPGAVDEREVVALIEPRLASPLLIGAFPEGRALDRFRVTRAGNLADLAVAPLLRRVDLQGAPAAQNLAVLREALAIHPHHREVLSLLGELSLRTGELRAAEGYFGEVMEIEPNDVQAARGLAFVLHRSGRAGEAIDLYERVLSVRPDDAETHNNLGVALAARGDLARARHHFERALTLRPDYRDAARNLGLARRAGQPSP